MDKYLIVIYSNLLLGIVLFGLLIFDNVCPVYVGFFYMFTLIYSTVRSTEVNIRDIQSNNIKELLIYLIFEFIFSIWGLFAIIEKCMDKFILQRIYGIILIIIHMTYCIFILKKLNRKRIINNNRGILDDDSINGINL